VEKIIQTTVKKSLIAMNFFTLVYNILFYTSLNCSSFLSFFTSCSFAKYFLFIKPNIMHYVLLRGQAISRSVPTANLLWIIFIVLQKLISCKFFCAIKLHLDFSYFKKLCSSLTHIFFRWWVPTFFC
jgi:hypothetical protein